MSGEALGIFSLFGFFAILLFVIGFYCILVTRNMIRAIIGVELLVKGVTLFFTAIGYITKRTALVQTMVINIIIIEVVIVVIVGGLALRTFRYNDSLDTKRLRNLKG